MRFKMKYCSCTFVMLISLFCMDSAKPLQFSSEGGRMEETVKKYFPHENNLCVVLARNDEETLLPTFHVPVVVYTQDEVFQHCESSRMENDGYVFQTSIDSNLEDQVVPLLNCFNKTTLKLKTKYILLVDSSKNINSDYPKAYSLFFYNLWNAFGIINIAILPVQSRRFDTDPPVIFSYNPFLARHSSISSGLMRSNLTQDVRGIMNNRFRNMHGHRLKTIFYRDPVNALTVKDLKEKKTVGSDPGILFKQILEAKLNVKFDIYESSIYKIISLENVTGEEVIGEVSSGKLEYCINYLPMGLVGLRQIQKIPIGVSVDISFVVPKPKQVESWRLFQYIFQWQVWVGLGVVLFLLSGASLLFKWVHSKPFSQNSSDTSEMVSVWKAALSVSINRLPKTNSQRLLLAYSMLLGVIFLTLFSVQLFALIKSKPRMASIKSLRDLHDSNLPIYTLYKEFSVYLNSFENTTLYKLKDNLKSDKLYEKVNYLDPTYLIITDRALVVTKGLIETAMSLPQNKRFVQYFEVVKEPLFQDSLVGFFPFDSVYFEHFNDLSLRLIAGGFYLKWYEANKKFIVKDYSASPTAGASRGNQTSNDRSPLSYDDLKIAFYILYTGLTVSALCFFKEVCKF